MEDYLVVILGGLLNELDRKRRSKWVQLALRQLK